MRFQRKVKRHSLALVEKHLRAEAKRQKAEPPPRQRNKLGLVLLLLAMLLGALVTLATVEVLAAERSSTGTREAIEARLAGSPASDPRWAYVAELAAAIDRAALVYEVPPPILESVLFHESSYKLGVCGKAGELGLAQAHGAALAFCRAAGLDPTRDIDASVGCAAAWLDRAVGACGVLVRDQRRCRAERVGAACDGAIAAYLSGRCSPASDIVARRVALRLDNFF